MITTQGLTVMRAKRTILHDLTLTLRQGEVTGLIGPNGSGKSTLLAALSGALPYRGSVQIAGHEVATASPATLAGLRAVMAQQTTLSLPFSVAEVVAMGALTPPGARIPALLAELGLAGFGPRNAMALSGGEAQRMQLARALLQAETAGGTGWLMLDEPVSSLDLAHQIAVIDRARAHAVRGGALVVLHDLNLAVRGVDRLLVLQEGRIVADGAPSQVLTDTLLTRVYDCAIPVNRVPENAPFVLVQA
jgi:iron complex transport system ATP-binding protein